MLRVERATELSDELVEAFARLIPQLSKSAAPPGRAELSRILDSPATTVLIAREGDTIVGTLTLALVELPTGLRAAIEDVVVDESVRGRGIGEALAREAMNLAQSAGAHSVDLTSRPERAAANRLYERLGFRLRETNVYRYELGERSRGTL